MRVGREALFNSCFLLHLAQMTDTFNLELMISLA